MKKNFYQPELDALRFFAFACVFLNHAHSPNAGTALQNAGAYGMCIFFTLSSYLILTIILIERESTGSVDIRRFYVRRVLRIWPLYFAVLLFVYFWHRLSGQPFMHGNAVLACLFLLGNVYVIHHGWLLGPANPLWSLSVEEQFYVLIALVSRASRRTLVVVSCATISTSYVVLIWLGHYAASPLGAIWPNSFVQFQFFALGALLAILLQGRRVKIGNISRMLLLASGVSLWVLSASLFPIGERALRTRSLLFAFFFMLAGTAAVFFSVIQIEMKLPSFVLYLGKISYGLYMFHMLYLWLIFYSPHSWAKRMHLNGNAMGVLIMFGLTVLTASLSYKFFERPILKLKQRFETVKTREA